MVKILVTGAMGQIGSELVLFLREKYGESKVVVGFHSKLPSKDLNSGPVTRVDVTSRRNLEDAVDEYEIDTIYHLAAVLSARGESNPWLAWNVNVNGTYNVLEVAREKRIEKVFIPSSIAAFGPETPKKNTPQSTVQKPRTMYGISKVTGELLGNYYFEKFNLDVRGVRYPGIISYKTSPGGGTTDYAIEIFFEAIKHKKYTCFLKENTALPMMYMPDCVKAAVQIMEADLSDLRHHADYNVTAFSFSPKEIAEGIREHIPEFLMLYEPDERQKIADSWPKTIDDTAARLEWGWKPTYTLPSMIEDMLGNIEKIL